MVNIGTTENGMFSYEGMVADPNIIQRTVWEKKWGLTFRQSAVVSVLNMVDNKGMFGGANSVRGIRPYWAIGDYLSGAGKLGADFAYNGTTITLDTAEYREGDMIYINDGTNYAIVRLTASVDSSLNATCKVIKTDLALGSFLDGTDFYKLANAAYYHNEATALIDVKGDFMSNNMQRSRATSGIGALEASNDFIAEHTLEHNIRMAQRHYAQLVDNSLLYSQTKSTADASSSDYGVAGGFPYFYNPLGLTGSDDVANTNFVGQNYSQAGATFDSDSFEEWIASLSTYGSTTKVIAAGSDMFFKIYRAYAMVTQIRREAIVSLDLQFPSMWEVVTFTTPGGDVQLILDKNANLKRTVVDNIGGSLTSTMTTDWCLAIDLSMTKLIYMDVDGEGVKTPQVRNIAQVRNRSAQEAEIDSVWTLAIKDPRAGGFYALNGA